MALPLIKGLTAIFGIFLFPNIVDFIFGILIIGNKLSNGFEGARTIKSALEIAFIASGLGLTLDILLYSIFSTFGIHRF